MKRPPVTSLRRARVCVAAPSQSHRPRPSRATPATPVRFESTLPGEAIAGIEPARPRIRSGEVERSQMTQIARVTLAGAFAEDGAFGTDLAFTGHYAIAGNYQGFAVYDITTTKQPPTCRPGRLPRARRTTCRSTRTC